MLSSSAAARALQCGAAVERCGGGELPARLQRFGCEQQLLAVAPVSTERARLAERDDHCPRVLRLCP